MVQHVEQTIVFRYFDMRSVCNTSLQRYSQLFYRDIYFDTPCIIHLYVIKLLMWSQLKGEKIKI